MYQNFLGGVGVTKLILTEEESKSHGDRTHINLGDRAAAFETGTAVPFAHLRTVDGSAVTAG